MFNNKNLVFVDFKCLAIKSYMDFTILAALRAKNLNAIH